MADSHPLDRERFLGLDIRSLRHGTQRDLADMARDARDAAELLAEHNRRCSFCVANKLTVPPLPQVPAVPLTELVPYMNPAEAYELLEAEHIAGRLAQVPTNPLASILAERFGNLKPMEPVERAAWIADGLMLHYQMLASVFGSLHGRLLDVLHAPVDAEKPLSSNPPVESLSPSNSDTLAGQQSDYLSPPDWQEILGKAGKPSSPTSWRGFKTDAKGENHPRSGDKLVRFPLARLRELSILKAYEMREP